MVVNSNQVDGWFMIFPLHHSPFTTQKMISDMRHSDLYCLIEPKKIKFRLNTNA